MTVRIQDTIKMKHYLMNRSSLKKAIKKQIPIKEPAFVKKILFEFSVPYFIASLTALPIFPLGS